MRSSYTILFHTNYKRKPQVSSSVSASLERTTLVLRNLPGPWGARNKNLVQDFVRRVFLAQPALLQQQSRVEAHNNNLKSNTMSNIMDTLEKKTKQHENTNNNNSKDKSELDSTTVPAGHIPPHIREKWGLSSLDSSSSSSMKNDFSQGLSKYFNNSKKQQNNNNNNNVTTMNSTTKTAVTGNARDDLLFVPQHAAQLLRIKFNGEIRRTMSVAIQFRSARAAQAFAALLPMYLGEVRRSRGLSIPASLVGEVADTQRIGFHHQKPNKHQQQEKHQQDNDYDDGEGRMSGEIGMEEYNDNNNADYNGTVTAATLDFVTSNCGMYCTLPAREELPDLLKIPERRSEENNDDETNANDPLQKMIDSSSSASTTKLTNENKNLTSLRQAADVIRRDKERRKELALALFRSVGKRPHSSTDSNNNNDNQVVGSKNSLSTSTAAATEPQPDQVRTNVALDLRFRQHDAENLYEARTEELNELMENNPLLNLDDDLGEPQQQQTSGTSLFIDPSSSTKAENEIETTTTAAKSKKKVYISPRLFGASIQALTFYEPRNNNKNDSQQQQNKSATATTTTWQDAASEEELAACGRISLDRYMMSPDVLWGIRKKYMPRRIWRSGGGGDSSSKRTDDENDDAATLDSSDASSLGMNNNEDDDGENVIGGGEENEDVVEGGQFIFANRGRMRRITKREVDRQKQDHEERWGLAKNKKTNRDLYCGDDEEKKSSKSDKHWWTTEVFG